jgi:hypothetical protein
MRVILKMSVFTDEQVDQTDLHALFHLGYKKRHWIQTEPEWNPIEPLDTTEMYEWLQRQDTDLRIAYESVLTSGLVEQETTSASVGVFTVQVSNVSTPIWDNKTAILSVSEAVKFLNRPLHLLLENYINDRNFLLAVFFAIATEEQKKRLEDCLKKRWIEFENGCGLGGILKRVEEILDNKDDQAKHRTWVMFDSDALRLWYDKLKLGGPSRQSKKLKSLCSENSVYHHQLERRAIENYLPFKALHTWMNMRKGSYTRYKKNIKGIPSKKLLDAFKTLSPEQCYHFNMKTGFEGDFKEGDRELQLIDGVFGDKERRLVGDFYRNLNEKDKKALVKGFGEHIAELFKEKQLITKERLIEDRQLSEIEKMLEEILALV